MRYKFRGKETISGRWVYGSLLIKSDESPVPETNQEYTKAYITEQVFFANEYEVDVDSIGQYTGLKDCKGVEIYEGDILKCLDPDGDDYLSFVRYDEGAFIIDVNYCDYDYAVIGWALAGDVDDVEIIGNVHDNPELLKGGEK